MSQKNETTALIIALLATAGIVGGGYFWLQSQLREQSKLQSERQALVKEKAKLEAIASETREAIKNKVALETITQKSVDLQNAMMEFNKAIAPFAQSDAGSNTSDSSSDHSNSSSGDDVIDAEFKASQVD